VITLRGMVPDRLPWLAQRARLSVGPGFEADEAVLYAGTPQERTIGAIGFDGHTPNSVSMHIAMDSPIAFRALLRWAFYKAFVKWNKGVVTCLVLGSNHRSQALVDSVGFRKVFTGRDYWAPGEDMLVYEMRREECVWLQDKPPRIRGSARRRKARVGTAQNGGAEAA
jgi:hypothetical protein